MLFIFFIQSATLEIPVYLNMFLKKFFFLTSTDDLNKLKFHSINLLQNELYRHFRPCGRSFCQTFSVIFSRIDKCVFNIIRQLSFKITIVDVWTNLLKYRNGINLWQVKSKDYHNRGKKRKVNQNL